MSQTYWPYVETVDIVVIDGLLRQLQERQPVTGVAQSFFEYIQRTLEESGLDGRNYEVTLDLLCAPVSWQDDL